MIPVERLKILTNQLAYARLLKDAKKLRIDINKLRMPENPVKPKLLSTRVKSIFKAVFRGVEFNLNKQRYGYQWGFCLVGMRDIFWNEHEFYTFFSNHPDVKRIERKHNIPVDFCHRYFTVFSERDINSAGVVLEYNSKLLKEMRKYSRFAKAVLAAYPEIKEQWQNRHKIDIQQKYDEIAARKAREKEEAANNQGGESNDSDENG